MLPITDSGKWSEESQRDFIDVILGAHYMQALVACIIFVTLEKSPPSGFYPVFGVNVVCSVLCRLSFSFVH